MGVVVGPWDGARAPEAEYDDRELKGFRLYAEYLEGLLASHIQPHVPVDRRVVDGLAEYFRARERFRLQQLERLHPRGELHRLQESVEFHRQLAHRVMDEKFKMERQVKRERRGTPLRTLNLDDATQTILWNADIVTVEELIRHTQRPNWLIHGVGPKRRAEIIAAVREEPR
jgi:hypothetical protein